MYRVSGVTGCVFTSMQGINPSVGVTIHNDATVVSFIVNVVDSAGLESNDTITISRTGSNVVQPTGDSGQLTSGTHSVTIPSGVSSISITGNGGAGLLAAPGDPTNISGAVTHTFAGSAYGVTTAPAASTIVKAVNPTSTNTLNVMVATNGGSLRIQW